MHLIQNLSIVVKKLVKTKKIELFALELSHRQNRGKIELFALETKKSVGVFDGFPNCSFPQVSPPPPNSAMRLEHSNTKPSIEFKSTNNSQCRNKNFYITMLC